MTATQVVDFDALAPRIEQALRKLVKANAIVEMEPGYQGRVRVKLVSSYLNGMSEKEKQSIVWDVLRLELGEDAQWVSFVIAYGTDEL